MTSEERAYFWLASKLPINTQRMSLLMDKYGNARFIAQNYSDISHESPTMLLPTEVLRLDQDDEDTFCSRVFSECERINARVITRISPDFPEELLQYNALPNYIYVRGTLPSCSQKKVSVVGARRCTQYGASVTKNMVECIAASGACIVSGMAKGIDGIAANTALRVSTESVATVAVIAGGIEHIYPREHRDLYYKIIERGAVIAQYEPGTPLVGEMFPTRNKVIAAYCDALMITEADEHGGTLITAKHALEYSKRVFSVPGRITDVMSRGANRLIADGLATLLISPQTIMAYLGSYSVDTLLPESAFFDNDTTAPQYRDTDTDPTMPIRKRAKTIASPFIQDTKSKQDLPELDENEQIIYDLLRSGDKSFEELCELVGFSSSELNLVLTSLEFSTIIKQSPGRVYSIDT